MNDMYVDKIMMLIHEVRSCEKESILKASEIIATGVQSGNKVYVFGASHAGIISEEVYYRAGGLSIFHPIFEPSLMLFTKPIVKTTELEQLEGFGRVIANNVPFCQGDILILHSVSGRNPVSVEMAIEAKKRGVYIIALTNLKYSQSVTSRSSSGLRLFEVADLVIDNHGDIGDASITLDGLDQSVAPTSTVIGAMVMNMIVVNVVEALIKKGVTPPVFHSANLDGGSALNKRLL